MKLSKNNDTKEKSRIRVKIEAIKEDVIECSHLSSNFRLKAFYKKEMQLEVGQLVLLEYSVNKNSSGYVVVDTLTEEVNATILSAQHIMSDGTLYVSIILENNDTKCRIHSLFPSGSAVFNKVNTLVSGDSVTLKLNNGAVFSISLNK